MKLGGCNDFCIGIRRQFRISESEGCQNAHLEGWRLLPAVLPFLRAEESTILILCGGILAVWADTGGCSIGDRDHMIFVNHDGGRDIIDVSCFVFQKDETVKL